MLIQDNDSHHKGRILLQLKNRWAASSSLLLQNGHNVPFTTTCPLLRFSFFGNLSLISLHANTDDLAGILSFHSSSKTTSRFSPLILPIADHTRFLLSSVHLGQVSKPKYLLYVGGFLFVLSPQESHQPLQFHCQIRSPPVELPFPFCTCVVPHLHNDLLLLA